MRDNERRQIKFRQPIFFLGRFHKWHYWGFIDGEFIGVVPPLKEAQETSQQFTGLLDKNGKEIYERDIITWSDNNERKQKLIIQWDNESSRYRAKWNFYESSFTKINEIRMEVIGNIYENKELLKKEDN